MADAVLVAHLQDGTEIILDYVFERVSVTNDFWICAVHQWIVSYSMYKRFHERSKKIFVLEGDSFAAALGWHLTGESAETSAKYVFSELTEDRRGVIQRTKSVQETANLYYKTQQEVHARLSGNALDITSIGQSFVEWTRKMSERLDDSGLELTLRLQLQSLPGVSREEAKEVANVYKRPANLICEYQEGSTNIGDDDQACLQSKLRRKLPNVSLPASKSIALFYSH